MIRKEDISSRTNKGLDIIRHLYPDAGRVIDSGNLKQAFKVRNECTPSAHLKEYDLWWVVTDFGDDQRGHNPISLWMMEKNLGFTEACIDINTELMLGLGDIKADVNHESILLSELAEPFMMLDNWVFRWNSNADFDASGMFPTEEYHNNGLCKDYGWRSVMWFGRCRDGVVERRFATKDWPIYMRYCRHGEGDNYHYFYEKFEPKAEPQFRYLYVGRKPRGYIHGLYELREKFLCLGRKIDDVVWCRNFTEAMRLSQQREITPLWPQSMLQDITLEQWREILGYATGVDCSALLSIIDEKPNNYGQL